jgi:hypothetical protein
MALLILSLVFWTCKQTNERFEADLSTIKPPQIHILDYGKVLLNTESAKLVEALPRLQQKYPFFLQGDLDDTLNIIRLTKFINTDYIQDAKRQCEDEYPDFHSLEKHLSTLFQRNKYFFPDFVYPRVYTYISGFDIERQVANYDSVLTISMDMYLGKDYDAYHKMGFPAYKIRFFDKNYILRDVADELNLFRIPRGKNFLENAIAEGKRLILLDALLPEVHDTIKIKYNARKLNWIAAHEKELWAFLIENDILYSTDAKILQKFFVDSPFTSYFGQESPARLGQWLGWQIVRNYFDTHPDMPLAKFVSIEDAQLILKQSNYHPQ